FFRVWKRLRVETAAGGDRRGVGGAGGQDRPELLVGQGVADAGLVGGDGEGDADDVAHLVDEGGAGVAGPEGGGQHEDVAPSGVAVVDVAALGDQLLADLGRGRSQVTAAGVAVDGAGVALLGGGHRQRLLAQARHPQQRQVPVAVEEDDGGG